MADLVAWLTQILDEDQAREQERADNGPEWLEEAASFGAPSPAAVLADIAAKRAIIEECAYWRDRVEQTADAGSMSSNYGADQYTVAAPILRFLASAYAARPGYDEEWRP